VQLRLYCSLFGVSFNQAQFQPTRKALSILFAAFFSRVDEMSIFKSQEVVMTRAFSLKEHHSWEDWLGVGLGAILMASPWLFGGATEPVVTISAVFLGILVMVLATMEFMDRQYWEETLEMAAGVWILACPFIYGYLGSSLSYAHLAIGTVIAALAVLEFLQPHTPPTTA
jgi:SPW repeat